MAKKILQKREIEREKYEDINTKQNSHYYQSVAEQIFIMERNNKKRLSGI